jgi:hypothetical protein
LDYKLMADLGVLLRTLPLEVFDAPKPDDAWARCALAVADDASLIQAVAASISAPKLRIDSSFLLHAPLELLARAWLLPRVSSSRRDHARRRIAEIATRYAAEGPEIEAREKSYPSDEAARSELLHALCAGDAETVDSALCFLTPRVPFEGLRTALAGHLLPLLGAAAHAPILLMQLRDAADRIPGSNALLRSPLRALALESNRRLTWTEAAEHAQQVSTPHLSAPHLSAPHLSAPHPSARRLSAPALFECLAAPEHRDTPSTSIAPTMLAVEHEGYAARVLAAVTNGMEAGTARRILLRVAALSMLQDDPAHAPYGWTHCFTLPQAILSLHDVAPDITRVIRVAATYVLGFRATLGRVRLSYPYAEAQRPIRAHLIERAAVHADAHLAKYTVACLTAADHDPRESALYLAAAAYLGAWWDSSCC